MKLINNLVWPIIMFDIISPLYVYRLARRRENDRARQAAMTPEQRKTILQHFDY